MSQRGLSRREFLKGAALGALGAGAVGALAGCGGSGSTAEVDGEAATPAVKFTMFSSLFYRGPQDDAYFAAAVDFIRNRDNYYCHLVGGDLVNDGSRANMQALKAHLDRLGSRVYCVPGDHDNFAYETDPTAWTDVFGPRNQAIGLPGRVLMCIDNTNGTGQVTNLVIPQATLEWVRNNKGTSRRIPMIILTHLPLVDAYKPLDQTEWDSRGRPLNADALLREFDGYTVLGIFCGHWRANFSDTATRPGTPIRTVRGVNPWKDNHDGSAQKGFYSCTISSRNALRVEFVEFPAP